MDGLFVRKYAQAVARYNEVCVLFLYSHPQVKSLEVSQQLLEGVREITIYYPKGNYLRASIIGVKQVYKTFGKPDIIHANIVLRPIIQAFILHLFWQRPYLITEHWSGFLPQNGTYIHHNRVYRWLCEVLYKRAKVILPVSRLLQQSMINCGIQGIFKVVYNVVDDFFYNDVPIERPVKKTLVHICCFNERAKNTRMLLQAVKVLSMQRTDFQLIILGTGEDFLLVKKYSEELQLNDVVSFVGEVPPMEVHRYLLQADGLVMSSHYETAGVVFEEAMACGKPIVSTKVGILQELFEKSNRNAFGIVVEDNTNISSFANAIDEMLNNLSSFDSNTIRQYAKAFQYDTIGKELNDIYLAMY